MRNMTKCKFALFTLLVLVGITIALSLLTPRKTLAADPPQQCSFRIKCEQIGVWYPTAALHSYPGWVDRDVNGEWAAGHTWVNISYYSNDVLNISYPTNSFVCDGNYHLVARMECVNLSSMTTNELAVWMGPCCVSATWDLSALCLGLTNCSMDATISTLSIHKCPLSGPCAD